MPGAGAVCPSCGVAVLPGYVRCPKCRKPLPRRAVNAVEGGTVVEERRAVPVVALIAAAVIGVGLIFWLGLRRSDDKPAQPSVAPAPTAEPVAAEPVAAEPEPPAAPTGPDPNRVVADLERDLKKQRLWAKVDIVGDRVDVRSGSCADAAMAPMLDAAAPALKAAGLTKLRCLEQSGRVVTDRDL